MTGNYWLWVFEKIEMFHWMREHGKMPIRPVRVKLTSDTTRGDKVLFYMGRSAFRNPAMTRARIGGLGTIQGPAELGEYEIDRIDYGAMIPVEIDFQVPDHTGPIVSEFVEELSFVANPKHWGTYFRFTPQKLTKEDFAMLHEALESVRIRQKVKKSA